jgi:hypothetical protein
MKKNFRRLLLAESVSSSDFRIAVIYSCRTDSGDGSPGRKQATIRSREPFTMPVQELAE